MRAVITKMLIICFVFFVAACSPRERIEEPAVSESRLENTTPPKQPSIELPVTEDEIENVHSAIFALGHDGWDEKPMSIGDSLGGWTLKDLQIQYDETGIGRLDAVFIGNVTINGAISRSFFMENGFDFLVDKEDEVKIPHYISPEMSPKDRLMFMLDIPDDITNTLVLEYGDEIECKIAIIDYHFIFAYMMAPSKATVISIEIL